MIFAKRWYMGTEYGAQRAWRDFLAGAHVALITGEGVVQLDRRDERGVWEGQ